MQDQTNETVGEQDHNTEQTILILLLGSRQYVWSVDELVGLKAAGLVHRCGEFVFATRAAIRLDGIFQD